LTPIAYLLIGAALGAGAVAGWLVAKWDNLSKGPEVRERAERRGRSVGRSIYD